MMIKSHRKTLHTVSIDVDIDMDDISTSDLITQIERRSDDLSEKDIQRISKALKLGGIPASLDLEEAEGCLGRRDIQGCITHISRALPIAFRNLDIAVAQHFEVKNANQP